LAPCSAGTHRSQTEEQDSIFQQRPHLRLEQRSCLWIRISIQKHRTGHHKWAIHWSLRGPWVNNRRKKGARDGFDNALSPPHVHTQPRSHTYITTYSQ
jgi:hypothetical protein